MPCNFLANVRRVTGILLLLGSARAALKLSHTIALSKCTIFRVYRRIVLEFLCHIYLSYCSLERRIGHVECLSWLVLLFCKSPTSCPIEPCWQE